MPAFLWMKTFAGDDLQVEIFLLNFFYIFHPLISLIACAFIVQTDMEEKFLAFASISISFATLSTHAFALGQVGLSLSLFWPLLILHRRLSWPKNSAWAGIGVLAIIGLLSFSYEMSVILTGLLLCQHWQLYRFGQRRILVALVASFLWITARIIFPFGGAKRGFYESLLGDLGEFRIWTGVSLLVIISVVFFLPRSRRRWQWILLTFWTAGSLGLIISYLKVDSKMGFNFFNSRISSIPMAFCLAVLCLLLSDAKFVSHRFILRFFVCVSISVGCSYDWFATARWSEGRRGLEKILKTKEKCVVVSRNEFESISLSNGLTDWNLEHTSVILQRTRNPNVIAFAQAPDGSSFLCSKPKSNVFTNAFDVTTPILEKGFHLKNLWM
ncbi:MAG: hypothetical protein LW875_05305 [Proteobacteria bacterium]|nr:hypothetical protein [Pseudomonadota bacterium]